MSKFFILLGFVSASIALPKDFSGWAVGPKVVGGEEAIPHEFPFMVSVHINGNHYCGGTIYDADTIITAAQCIQDPLVPDGAYTIRAGRHNIMVAEEPTQQLKNISARILHPEYPGHSIFSNDIGIIKLAEPLRYTAYVGPIPIASAGYTATGDGIILGWGYVEENSSAFSPTLQKVSVPFVTDEVCRAAYGDGAEGVDENNICAGFPDGGKDACLGDSGGPIVANDRGTGYYLAGITNGGAGCGVAGYPGIYAEVSHFNEFIEQNA